MHKDLIIVILAVDCASSPDASPVTTIIQFVQFLFQRGSVPKLGGIISAAHLVWDADVFGVERSQNSRQRVGDPNIGGMRSSVSDQRVQ
jgi:hypothetical protein